MSKESSRHQAVLAHQRFQAQASELRSLDLAGRFERIYATNLWGSEESRSGLGSQGYETARLRETLPALLRELGASSLLDMPCGDFGWLSQADLSGIQYTGADIVPELVARNNQRFGGPARRFMQLDLTADDLPKVDVVLCRDCLVHLSFAHIAQAVAGLRRSGSAYLLTTTFPDEKENRDIEDGDWRPLNLETAPFFFPPPLKLLVEGCTEADGAFADKALGLWRIADLRE